MKFKNFLFKLFLSIKKSLSGKGLGNSLSFVAAPVVNYLYKRLRPLNQKICFEQEGVRFNVYSDDLGVTPAFFFDGSFESQEIQVFKSLVRPGMNIVDIGANIGIYTLIAAKLIEGKGTVYAFEPEPENFSLLKENIELNSFQNIEPFQYAISNSNSKIKLYLNKQNRGDHRIINPEMGKNYILVDSYTLDSFIGDKRIDIIKMDIQGAEPLAVQGMKRIIDKNEYIIIFSEFSPFGLKDAGFIPADYIEFFIRRGFNAYEINEQEKKMGRFDIRRIEQLEKCEASYTNLVFSRRIIN